MELEKIRNLVSPILTLTLALFVFPAKTYAAPTIVSFTTVGTTQWAVPARVTSVDYLVVGGGGGGGSFIGGGGGAGGMRTGTLTVTPGASLTVTVGAGGAIDANGGDSVFSTITSTGGGKGGLYMAGTGGSGGSGGGGAGTDGVTSSSSGGAGNTPSTSPSQGNSGGGASCSSVCGGAGGGGAGAVGATSGQGPGSAGGNGSASSISGSSVTYAGGGGGGARAYDSGEGGAGGSGGGGHGGGKSTGSATAGSANTGGGGGGHGFGPGSPDAAAGGSGIVILSYTPSPIQLTGNVQFKGALAIVGALSKGSGTFVIDHPLDPKNKLLYHSFVESPDVMNIYDGIAKLDKNGEAEIKLPSYFMALNKNFQYEFSAIGKAMPNLYVEQEIKDNKFTIAGGKPRGKISWQVTGIRHDPYILAHPIIVEVEKGSGTLARKGEYLFPEAYAGKK